MLAPHRWSAGFRDWYLVPLGSSIWSADPTTFTRIPAATFARFFERHGLLQLARPAEVAHRRRAARGATSRPSCARCAEGRLRLGTPVDKIRREAGGVELVSRGGVETYDHVVVATHSDQALRLLSDPDRMERETLGALRYQPNRATLHTDASLLPTDRRAWASWNYHRLEAERDEATLTYHLNQLQGIDSTTPVLVTLNQDDAIDPEKVLARMDYAHPVLDPAAVRAQGRPREINGARRTWFGGAYWGYGFHEDGVRSAVETCRALGVTW